MFTQMQAELIPTRSAISRPFFRNVVRLTRQQLHQRYRSQTLQHRFAAHEQTHSRLVRQPLILYGVLPNHSYRYSAVAFVGQAQLLRRVFASELNFSAQLDR